MDNGPHAFDLIRYLLGEFETVFSQGSSLQAQEVEDTAQVNCRLVSGAQGTINLSWSASVPAKSYLEIYGEDGAILLDFEGIWYKFKTWSEWKRIPNQKTVKEAFARQIDHFVAAIKGNKSLVINNDDGLKAQLVIEAAYSSLSGNCMKLVKSING